ncbi:MAG TPA: cytochrome c [Gemmataceae bacterium]|nr:cytochrome c [Gemmataceae bacterium]
MRRMAAKFILGAALLALGMGVVTASDSNAGMADVRDGVQAIADALAKGDTEGAKKLAAEQAKNTSVEDAMHLFGLRKAGKSKGYGVGDEPGKILPDGIEAKVMAFSKKAPTKAVVSKDADAYVKMAYRAAAVAEIALNKAPEKDMGDKKVKDWNTWATNMRDGSLELAEALKAKDPAKVKTAAYKAYSSCSSCHGVFRD